MERIKRKYYGKKCSKKEIIEAFIEEISETLVDENKEINDNAKEKLETLIQDWLEKIPVRMIQTVQTKLTFEKSSSNSKSSGASRLEQVLNLWR